MYNKTVPGEQVTFKEKTLDSYNQSNRYNDVSDTSGREKYYFTSWAAGTDGILYNADLLKQYSIEVPRTSDEWLASLAKIKAAKGENEEAARAYPAFARTAREEGYADAAALWENIARIEAMHRDVFLESYNQMQTERLYRKERPIVWRCLNCGFVLLAKEAFRVCPVCGKDRGWAEGDIETRRLGKEG